MGSKKQEYTFKNFRLFTSHDAQVQRYWLVANYSLICETKGQCVIEFIFPIWMGIEPWHSGLCV